MKTDGLRHEQLGRTALWIAAALAIAGATAWGWARPAAFWLGMWLGIYIINPDVDFLALTYAETRWFRDPRRDGLVAVVQAVARFHVGWLALALGLWPGLLLSHRGVSHWPIVGAIVIVGLTIPSVPVATLLCWLAYVGKLHLLISPVAVTGLAGFVGAHLVHIVHDWL